LAFCLLALLVPAGPAFGYDNAACWHYAEQQGPRPDVTCTPVTLALLQSLETAKVAQVAVIFDEPGIVYPDGTLHYVGDDQTVDGGYQGEIVLTLAGGLVTGIDATLDNPDQGGAYYHFHWAAGADSCSDLPGSSQTC
jgi:hypothetical protein